MMTTAALLGALAVGGYFGWPLLTAGAGAGDSIPTVEVRHTALQVSVSSIGALRAAQSQSLSAPFEGKIIKLVPEGTRVAAGDPVIWFETVDIEEELKEAEAQLALDRENLKAAEEAYRLEEVRNQYSLDSEKTKVEIARQQYEDRKQRFESEKVLFERNISPQTKLEEARLALLQSELSLRNAQINLAKVEENLSSNLRVKQREIDKARLAMVESERKATEASEKLDTAVVRTTSPGDVSYLQVWQGGSASKVTEGTQVWRTTNLVEIPDPSVMLAVIPLNEIDNARVEAGQRAEVSVAAVAGRTFAAVVDGKSPVPISDSSAQPWAQGGSANRPREFEVRVRLEETHPSFRQGMTASVRIIVAEQPDALTVPIEAVMDHEGRAGVWRQATLGTSEFVPVEVKLANDTLAAVEGTELREGDRILLNSPVGESKLAAVLTPSSGAKPNGTGTNGGERRRGRPGADAAAPASAPSAGGESQRRERPASPAPTGG